MLKLEDFYYANQLQHACVLRVYSIDLYSYIVKQGVATQGTKHIYTQVFNAGVLLQHD